MKEVNLRDFGSRFLLVYIEVTSGTKISSSKSNVFCLISGFSWFFATILLSARCSGSHWRIILISFFNHTNDTFFFFSWDYFITSLYKPWSLIAVPYCIGLALGQYITKNDKKRHEFYLSTGKIVSQASFKIDEFLIT